MLQLRTQANIYCVSVYEFETKIRQSLYVEHFRAKLLSPSVRVGKPDFIDGAALLSACSPRFAQFYGLWDSKRAGRVMPSRSDFEISDLKPWLGWIALLGVLPGALPEGHDFVYRLVGTSFTRYYEADPTQQRVSEASVLVERDLTLQNLRVICDTRTPRYRSDSIMCARFEAYRQPRLYVPLGEDGNSVDVIMLLGCDPHDSMGRPVFANRSFER